MQLVITSNGTVKCLYQESIDLHKFGKPNIKRASHVEPTLSGEWQADLSPVGGPILGPFKQRSAALEAEVNWLEQHWLS